MGFLLGIRRRFGDFMDENRRLGAKNCILGNLSCAKHDLCYFVITEKSVIICSVNIKNQSLMMTDSMNDKYYCIFISN